MKLTINAINWSLLKSPPTYDYDETDNGVSISTVLEPIIKHVIKETIRGRRASHHLVSRIKNIRE